MLKIEQLISEVAAFERSVRYWDGRCSTFNAIGNKSNLWVAQEQAADARRFLAQAQAKLEALEVL